MHVLILSAVRRVSNICLWPPSCVQHMHQLQASLMALGVPCFLSGMARGLLGRNSPIHIRQNRKRALREVRDCCLFAPLPLPLSPPQSPKLTGL